MVQTKNFKNEIIKSLREALDYYKKSVGEAYIHNDAELLKLFSAKLCKIEIIYRILVNSDLEFFNLDINSDLI